MLKKFTLLVIGVLVAFSLLTGFNLSRIYMIKAMASYEIDINGPSYKTILAIYNETSMLKDVVTQAALVKELDAIEKNKLLESELTTSIHANLDKTDETYLNSLSESGAEQITIEGLKNDFIHLKAESKKSIDSAIELLHISTDFEKEKKELSKVFRNSDELRQAEEAWPKISRAVLTVLSSKSNKDIAYGGRAVFSDAVRYFEKNPPSGPKLEKWNELKAQFEKSLELAIRVSSVSEDNQLGIFRESLTQFNQKILILKKSAEKKFDESQQSIVGNSSGAFFTSLTLSILLTICFTILIFTMTRQVRRNILASFSSLSAIARSLGEIAFESSSTGEVLGKNAQTQAKGLQQTSSAVTEITSMVEQTQSNSSLTLKIAESASDLAMQGLHSLEATKQKIERLDEVIKNLLASMNQNSKGVQSFMTLLNEVAVKTKIINDIVFQTKLLSFNASVEAARAGESGKGFSVVASEIANLAAMSGKAASEINDIMQKSNAQGAEILGSIDKSMGESSHIATNAVSETMDSADLSHRKFRDIISSISNVLGNCQQIATACGEQSRGVREVQVTMLSFEEMNVELAGNASKSYQTSRALESDSENLKSLVSQMGLEIIGKIDDDKSDSQRAI